MKKIILLTILANYIISNAYSQKSYDLPPDLRCETNITEPTNLRKGFFRTSLGYAFAPIDSYFGDSGKTRLLGNSSLCLSGVSSYTSYYRFNASYGISNRLNVGITLWYFYGKETWLMAEEIVPRNEIVNIRKQEYRKGIDDVNLGLSYQLFQQNDFYSTLEFGLTLPTGSLKSDTIVNNNYTQIRKPVSSDEYKVDFGFIMKKVIYPFSLILSPSYSYSLGNDKWKPTSTFSINGSGGVLLNSWFSLSNSWSLDYIPSMASRETLFKNKNIYNLYTGVLVNQQVKRFRVTENLKFPIAASEGYPSNMSLLFSIAYTW